MKNNAIIATSATVSNLKDSEKDQENYVKSCYDYSLFTGN